MQTVMFRKALDQFPGILLSAILLVVIGIFVIAVQPWKSTPSPTNSSHSTPTPTAMSIINGTVVFDCQSQACTKDYSAFDVGAFTPSNQSNPIAQTHIDASGHFTMQVAAGHYSVNTIPQSSNAISITTNQGKPASITLHIKVTTKTP